MTDPVHAPPEPDILPPATPSGALSVPPPVPQKQPGFLRRLFMTRKKQQAIAVQNGYLEMVDLIRAIRSHLDRQESVQTRVLAMLEKVPDAMDRQHEVMAMFKQQLETGMENNRRLTDSMGNLNHTLAAMDESQRASSRTITDLIHRSRESEQLLREVMRRAERRMTILLAAFVLIVVGLALYFGRGQIFAGKTPESESPAPVSETATALPSPPETAAPVIPAEPAPAPALRDIPKADSPEQTPPPPKPPTRKRNQPRPAETAIQPPPAPAVSADAPEFKPEPGNETPPSAPPPEAPAPVGQPDLTIDYLQQASGAPVTAPPSSPVSVEPPVSLP